MAKIYETPEDIERERLGDEATRLRRFQREGTTTGILSVGLGLTSLQIDRLQRFEAEALKQPRNWLSRANKPVGWLLGALGIVSFAQSFSNRGKALKAEMELKELGPEQIVLPDDTRAGPGAQEHSFASTQTAKSLLDHAQRDESPPEQIR